MGHPYDPQEWSADRSWNGPCAAERRVLRSLLSHEALTSALPADEERYRYTLALSPLIPWIADARGAIVDIDPRGLQRTGLSHDQCLGDGFLAAVHASDKASVKAAWRQARTIAGPFDQELRLRLDDGSYRWHRSRAAPRRTADGGILCWYGTIEDIDDRKLADEALRWTADHDDLTGLWNRRAFMTSLRKALAGAEGTGIEIALLLIDLDGFKPINDRYGHDAGDALLKAVARRLEGIGNGDAIAGRLGGDEFGLFIYLPDRALLEQVVGSLKSALAEPCLLQGQSHVCRASIGASIYPSNGLDAEILYKNADLALYAAKASGGGARYFHRAMQTSMTERLAQLAIARTSLEQDRVVPFYQPKVDLRTGLVTGFEALLRWRHEASGPQAPGTIAAAFEDAELAIALDERMFDRVAADIGRWRSDGLPFGRIALNVSAAEFGQVDFAEQFLARASRSGIPPQCLELEITETVFLDKAPRVRSKFEQLRDAGITIALDDFGTGYASLVHLKQFPVDVLKIDCSFIQALSDTANAAIVRAIADLGRSLGIVTVAEGIEMQSQADWLVDQGCTLAQGHLFSPAIPAEQVPETLARQNALADYHCGLPAARRA